MAVILVRYAISFTCLLAPAAASAEWKKYETEHFVVHSEAAEKDVTQLAERLEKVDGLMRMATSLADKVEPVKVRIYHVASNIEVAAALGLAGQGSGVGGFYNNNILGPFAVTPRRTTFQTGSFTPELVLHHEYAHHFMLQYFPSVYPSWYVEGFAELIGSSKFMPDGKIGYGMPAKHRGSDIAVNWVPLNELMTKPPEKIHALDTYGQGWALTHYLTFDKTRAAQLRRYLGALNTGAEPAKAASMAFGDLAALNRDALRYVRSSVFEYRPVAVPLSGPVIQKTTPLTPGEAALIPETMAFRDEEMSFYRKPGAREREQRLRGENLERIRQKAARFANDPYALYLLGEAEYAAGNLPRAEAAVDQLLTLQPGHVRGKVRKSILLSHAAGALSGPARAAKAAQARQLALQANRADPDDALPLMAFYQSYNLAGEPPVKQAVDGLIGVVATLPHDSRIRQLLVDELARQKRWAEAIAVLSPLANDPHDSPRRTAAREQMVQLRAQLGETAKS
jgi:tetratricopeptide (TPR) repeat protein